MELLSSFALFFKMGESEFAIFRLPSIEKLFEFSTCKEFWDLC
jgi:hypothetical protein